MSASPIDPERAAVPVAPGGFTSVVRGAHCRCPACGTGPLFGRFLKVAEGCTGCGQPFHHHRADDFPPYIVMFAVGHLVGFGIYMSETRIEDVPIWLHAVLWPTLAVVLSLGLLQPVKGAVIGLQFALGMHGFGGAHRAGGREHEVERGSRGATSEGLRDGR